MVDGSAQSGARLAFSDICWNGGHVRRGFFRRQVVDDCFCLLCEGVLITVVRCVMGVCVFVFRDGVPERLLSYVPHFR